MNVFNSRTGVDSIAVFCVSAFLGLASVNAALLNPGSTLTLRSALEPDGGHLLAQTNFTFATGSFSGTLTSKVWADDESNPLGGLTFTYKLSNLSCDEALGLFSLRGFGGSLTDVNYSGDGVAPRTGSRSFSGNEITFGFYNRHGAETLLTGDTSAWLVIQTGCTTWGLNQWVGMGAEDVIATTFAPVAVPEPVAMALFGMAGAALVLMRRR